MGKKFISEFLPNLTSGELDSSQSSLEIKNAAETLTAVESESGRDMSVDGAKLDGIEAGATADQTDAEILTAVESESGRDMSVDGAKLDTLDKINPIADKATAYALTGVPVGTVYKTTDTGQRVEKLFTDGIAPLDQGDGVLLTNANADIGSSELLHLTGGTYRELAVSNPANPLQSFQTGLGWVSGDDDLEVIASFNIALVVGGQSYLHNQLYAIADSANAFLGGTAGKWGIGDQQYAGNILYESVEDSNTVHPADATWVALVDGVTVPTITRYSPVSWMLDGVIQTPTNDTKKQLTSLPNNREVNVFQEGGRIERYNGDNAGILTSFAITGTAADYAFDSYAMDYVWDASYARVGGGYGAYVGSLLPAKTPNVSYLSGSWVAWMDGYEYFTSPACDETTHPADVAGAWTPDSAEGTLADTDFTKLPEATESNWSAIKNTVELVVRDSGSNGTLFVNSVSVGAGATVNVGWVPVGGSIPIDANAAYTDWNVEKVNASAVSSGTAHMLVTDADPLIMGIPDTFPAGALVQIKNSYKNKP